MLRLGVNVDHVATLRQARGTKYPDVISAALLCEKAGAYGITAHLREDRRHIQDSDMQSLASSVKRLNMEMAVTEEMISIACRLKPVNCCLVPEKRQELTTEGGLDMLADFPRMKSAVGRLGNAGIAVSIFIDPEHDQIRAASDSGAPLIELHTGTYALSEGAAREREIERLAKAADFAHSIGLKVNAGHGIDYSNMDGILLIPHLVELNIGHSIISRSVFVGISEAVSEMIRLMEKYRG